MSAHEGLERPQSTNARVWLRKTGSWLASVLSNQPETPFDVAVAYNRDRVNEMQRYTPRQLDLAEQFIRSIPELSNQPQNPRKMALLTVLQTLATVEDFIHENGVEEKSFSARLNTEHNTDMFFLDIGQVIDGEISHLTGWIPLDELSKLFPDG